jgi:hypothetical protein
MPDSVFWGQLRNLYEHDDVSAYVNSTFEILIKDDAVCSSTQKLVASVGTRSMKIQPHSG